MSSSGRLPERKLVTLGHESSCPCDKGPLLHLDTCPVTMDLCYTWAVATSATGQCRRGPCRNHPAWTGQPVSERTTQHCQLPTHPAEGYRLSRTCILNKQTEESFGLDLTSHRWLALSHVAQRTHSDPLLRFRRDVFTCNGLGFAWVCSAVLRVPPGNTGAVTCRTEPVIVSSPLWGSPLNLPPESQGQDQLMDGE